MEAGQFFKSSKVQNLVLEDTILEEENESINTTRSVVHNLDEKYVLSPSYGLFPKNASLDQ